MVDEVVLFMLILAFVWIFWKSYGSFRFNRTVLFKLYWIMRRSDCALK
jgi:hypothetical protein